MLSWRGKTEKKVWNPIPFQISDSFDPIINNSNGVTPTSYSISSLNLDNLERRKFKIEQLQSHNIYQNFQSHNLLIQGDNYDVLNNLARNGFENQINLIYIDPPFMTNNDFYRIIQLNENETHENDKNNQNGGKAHNTVLRQRQYKDKWELDDYLDFMYDRLLLLKLLLNETGSIYVHLDENCVHYIKVIMDEIFGVDHFRRDIIWNTAALNVAGFKGMVRNNWIYSTGHILFYTKSNEYTFNTQYIPHSEDFIKKQYKYRDAQGKYRITRRNNKIYLDNDPGEPITNIWNDILSFNYVKTASNESVFYPTQKPELLLNRIIQASTKPGDIVLDCFNGSGTTVTVAEKLNRRWIGIDNNPVSIQTTSKRIQNVLMNTQNKFERSFLVYNSLKRLNKQEIQTQSQELKEKSFDFTVTNLKDKIIVKITILKPELLFKSDLRITVTENYQLVSDLYSLCDSIFMEFITCEDKELKKYNEYYDGDIFFINFADIPYKRNVKILGSYIFHIENIEDLQGKNIIVKVKIIDKFGYCHINSRTAKII